MHRTIAHTALALALLICVTADAWTQPRANSAAPTADEACEAAVAETIQAMRGRAAAQDVQFVAGRRVALPKSADETLLRGEGRYRGTSGPMRPFTYSCAFDAQSGTTSGIVFKETGEAFVKAEKPWEPDLTTFSPEACEAAAAGSLTGRYSRAGRIGFDPDTRKLSPQPNARTRLEGQGRIERAPGLNPSRFTYRCEFDTRSGKVLAVETGD